MSIYKKQICLWVINMHIVYESCIGLANIPIHPPLKASIQKSIDYSSKIYIMLHGVSENMSFHH